MLDINNLLFNSHSDYSFDHSINNELTEKNYEKLLKIKVKMNDSEFFYLSEVLGVSNAFHDFFSVFYVSMKVFYPRVEDVR